MDENILVNFIKEQSAATGRIEQAVKDLDTRLTTALPYLNGQIEQTKARVTTLEQSGLKAQGFAAAIGTLGGAIAGAATNFLPILKKWI